jgi:hypothetical protein
MLDGKAYKARLSDDPDPDLIPRLRDPALLKAFAALAGDLTMIMSKSGPAEASQTRRASAHIRPGRRRGYRKPEFRITLAPQL